MIRNYIVIAIRSMMRNKRYSFINILGLSVGVACCLLLALYIQDELSYDKHHKDGERIFRITSHGKYSKMESHGIEPRPRSHGVSRMKYLRLKT
jgi:putative ABC transport system permease protein